MKLSERFLRTQTEIHGEAGRAWLDALPGLLAELEAEWEIRLGEPYEGLSYHYVAPGVGADGAPIALKVGVPHPEMRSEIAALQTFDGRGAARLLRADEARGALLLERLEPGTTIVDLPEEAAASAAAEVMRNLWRPMTEGPFRTLEGWVDGFQKLRALFEGKTGPLPADLVEYAERTGAELLRSAEPKLIHGDLHHANILRASRSKWLAIDPKGLIADPAYEPGPFLGNPRLVDAATLGRRIDLFAAELPVDRERILAWSVVYATMSAWWTIEDCGGGWETPVELAQRLRTLR